jgi:hypothetical protein
VSPSHQVRRWRSCYRWTPLALLAHAFLVVAVAEHARQQTPFGLVPLTCSEVQHLLAALLARPVGDLGPGCAGRSGGADSRHTPAVAAW